MQHIVLQFKGKGTDIWLATMYFAIPSYILVVSFY